MVDHQKNKRFFPRVFVQKKSSYCKTFSVETLKPLQHVNVKISESQNKVEKVIFLVGVESIKKICQHLLR